MASHTITITPNGYVPDTTEVLKGDTVNFVNEQAGPADVYWSLSELFVNTNQPLRVPAGSWQDATVGQTAGKYYIKLTPFGSQGTMTGTIKVSSKPGEDQA